MSEVPDISIITFTLGGRPRYLAQCLDSVYNDINNQLVFDEIKVEHHLVLQGALRTKESATIDYFKETGCYKLIVHEWPQNIGIGAGLNVILPLCEAPLIFKMDDDCKIVSRDFFESALALHRRFPNSCFSPYPCGLTGNPGGPRGFKHSIWYDKLNDRIYTRRHVTHLGGFARFSPAHIIKNFQFPNDLIPGISGTEDGNFSTHCSRSTIEMFYLENGLIVEHNEATPGQTVRYPEYFSGRNYESSLNIEVLE